jgi:hypothetical protein
LQLKVYWPALTVPGTRYEHTISAAFPVLVFVAEVLSVDHASAKLTPGVRWTCMSKASELTADGRFTTTWSAIQYALDPPPKAPATAGIVDAADTGVHAPTTTRRTAPASERSEL